MASDDIEARPSSVRAAPQARASSEREMQKWARTLGIAPGRLKRAVAVVGITPRRIREYLRKNP